MSTQKSLTFVVFGGGGQVARHLARLGVQAGHKVVSVIRNENQYVHLTLSHLAALDMLY